MEYHQISILQLGMVLFLLESKYSKILADASVKQFANIDLLGTPLDLFEIQTKASIQIFKATINNKNAWHYTKPLKSDKSLKPDYYQSILFCHLDLDFNSFDFFLFIISASFEGPIFQVTPKKGPFPQKVPFFCIYLASPKRSGER